MGINIGEKTGEKGPRLLKEGRPGPKSGEAAWGGVQGTNYFGTRTKLASLLWDDLIRGKKRKR